MTRVVIAGAGIAGIPAAYAMKKLLGPTAEVTVVSDKEYFQFVPSNPWVAMGWREQADIAFSIGPHLRERGIDFIAKAVQRVTPERNQIRLSDGSGIDYDYLLLATGPQPAYDAIDGLGPEHGHTHSVIHVDEAVKAQAAYREFVRNPGPVIIGIAQRASILGPAYECAFLIDSDLRRRNIRDRVPITVVTPEPYVGHLGIGGDRETRQLLEQALKQHDIQYLCNVKTLQIQPGAVQLMECDGTGRDKQAHTLPFAYSIYWPEFHGVPALRNSRDLTDERGFVRVDQYLRNPSFPNVYAVGVCASHPDVDATPLGVGAPQSAYSIQNEVDTATHNILAAVQGADLTSVAPARARWLNDMGPTGATYLSEPQIPLRNVNWLKQGRWVHMAKIDFERYFINRIKLHAAGRHPSVHTQIANVVCQMETLKAQGGKVRALGRTLPKPLEVPIQREACIQLRALAKVLEGDPAQVAAELLGAAVRDAESYLSESMLGEVEQARREILVSELPENQPGVEFDSGGT